MRRWTEKMKLAFQVEKLGRHGTYSALPTYLQDHTESELAFQKRKIGEEESEKKRRKKSIAEKEVK